MKKTFIIAGIIFSCLFAASSVYACEACLSVLNFEETVEQSDLIIIGQKIGYSSNEYGSSEALPDTINVGIIEILKGESSQDVITVNSWDGMCGYGIVVDEKEYVMLLEEKNGIYDAVDFGCSVKTFSIENNLVDFNGDKISIDEFKDKLAAQVNRQNNICQGGEDEDGGCDSQKNVFVFKNIDLYKNLKGKIILRVEENGEAYYVNPADESLYSLGRPDDAFAVMREQGVGISNSDLNKIPVALSDLSGDDSDNDGLSDMFEDAVGTDKNKQDTDSDGYDDKIEITGDYDPAKGNGAKLPINQNFANKQKGKIFLQVERNGEAWYVNPADSKRYFLGRPADAFNVMRNLGLGISEDNFKLIIGEDVISQELVNPVANNPGNETDKKTYERSITFKIDDYKLEKGYKSYENFDFINIEGYDDNSPNRAVLPAKRVGIVLPLTAEVTKVELDRQNPIIISNVNIPVENPCPDLIGGNCLQYTEADEIAEEFNESLYYYEYDAYLYKILNIDYTPVSYNSIKNEALLYKEIIVKYSYESEETAVLYEPSSDKQYYNIGETINNNFSIINVGDEKLYSTVLCELRDRLQKTVTSEEVAVTIDAGLNTHASCSIKAPLVGGSYRIYTILKKDGVVIDEKGEIINVEAGQPPVLTTAYNYQAGEEGAFKLSFTNPIDEELDVAFGLIIFDGATPVAEFIPIHYKVGGKSTEEHEFVWDIPDDFSRKDYLVTGTIEINGYTTTVSQGILVE